MISEELITFKTAQLAKQSGFDIHVYYHYSGNMVNDLITLCKPDDPQVGQGWVLEDYNSSKWLYEKYSAPTQSLLQKWIREVHNFIISIDHRTSKGWSYRIQTNDSDWVNNFNTHELALEQALQEALTLIINRKDDNLS